MKPPTFTVERMPDTPSAPGLAHIFRLLRPPVVIRAIVQACPAAVATIDRMGPRRLDMPLEDQARHVAVHMVDVMLGNMADDLVPEILRILQDEAKDEAKGDPAPTSEDATHDRAVLSAWRIWTAEGRGMDWDEVEASLKIVWAAATEVWLPDMTEVAGASAILRRLLA